MSKDISKKTVSLVKRRALIKALPCFAMLTTEESKALADLMVEEKYVPGQHIVIEDALVDHVFIIVSGRAEVTRKVIIKKALKKNKVSVSPLAVIGPGDAIGLNTTGFFSTTGKRTATVTAITPTHVLSLDLKSFHLFLKKHHLQSAMYAAASQMLRIRLIKQSLPFAKLSYERTQWLASQVEEMTVPAGTIIFNQGEIGDRCYLIRSGNVEIFAINEDGSEHRLAMLKAPTLFGEATLITRDPRNATARAADNCELLVLQHKHLSELIETEKNVTDMFMTLMVDRSRPIQNSNVSAHHRTTPDGQAIVILKNPDNGSYFKLSQEGWFVWQQLNGKQTMHTITLALSTKFNIFAPDVVVALISKLAKAGFVRNVKLEYDPVVANKGTFWQQKMAFIRKFLEIRYAFGDADKWLTKVYEKGIYLLFTPLGKLLLSIIAIVGFAGFSYRTGDIISSFQLMPNIWWLLIGLVPVSLLSVALHELGHAFATKSYGYEVHYMGVGWYWLGPVAFTDTSDMWLSTRWARTVVNLAGIYTDILISGVCGILIVLISDPYTQAFLWLFALLTYINAFRMLSPLQELDGYYILTDLVDKPNLRQAAIKWLVKGFPKAIRQPRLFQKNLPEVIYWVACIVFIILVSILTLSVQTFVFKIIGLQLSSPYLSLTLPVLVAIISGLEVVRDIRKQAG